MITVLGMIASLVFFILAAIHFNWAFGGTWGFDNSLPTNEDGKRVLNPRKIDSAIVGFGLALFGFYYVLKSGLVQIDITDWINAFLGWIIPIVFMARSVGDFKFVGFFKKVKSTKFARLDSKYYSPLCLFLSLLGFVIQYFS